MLFQLGRMPCLRVYLIARYGFIQLPKTICAFIFVNTLATSTPIYICMSDIFMVMNNINFHDERATILTRIYDEDYR